MALTKVQKEGIETLINNNADNRVITGSGTANTLNGESNVVIDSSGRLLLGTTTEGQASADDLTIATTGNTGITVRSGTSNTGNIYFSDATSGAAEYAGYLSYSHSTNSLSFGTNDGTERMRIDSSGTVNIGSTGYGGGGASPILYLRSTSGRQMKIHNTASDTCGIQLSNNATGEGDDAGFQLAVLSTGDGFINNPQSKNIRVSTANTERIRIHDTGEVQIVSEKLTIGTSVTNGGVSDGMLVTEFNGSTKNGIKSRANPSAAEAQHLVFIAGSSEVGRIHTSSSSTSYATSSDYRLKENVTAISDGITRLKTLKPSRFNFIIDPDKTVDGFLAHEVTAVPEAITGTKDEVDSDNNPKYQTIDQSKLVPLLTAALQEAVAKIEVLETKVAALEAS